MFLTAAAKKLHFTLKVLRYPRLTLWERNEPLPVVAVSVSGALRPFPFSV